MNKTNKRNREFFRLLLTQIYFTYIQAIPLLLIIGMASGVAISFQAKMGLSFTGGNEHLGSILVVILFREAAPLFASLLLITRSATAVSAEIATMKVNLEIEALKIMGISTKDFVIKPRVSAAIISIFCMAYTLFLSSIVGAWIGANFTSYYPVTQLLNSLASSFYPEDIIFFILKTTIIGALVMNLACNRGLNLKQASFEVPIVTNMAVVDCLFVALGAQAVISGLLYLYHGIGI